MQIIAHELVGSKSREEGNSIYFCLSEFLNFEKFKSMIDRAYGDYLSRLKLFIE